MLKKFFLLLLTGSMVSVFELNAQLILIQDKDGFANMREKAANDGAVVGRVNSGQVCMLKEELARAKSEEGWSWAGQGNYFSSNILVWKYESDPVAGYIHRSRYVLLEELPALKAVSVKGNCRTFSNDSLQLEICQRDFQSSRHKIDTKNGKVDAIDDHFVWGTNGVTPMTEVKNISISIKDKKWLIPFQAVRCAYQPNLARSKVYIGTGGVLYIHMTGGDGSGTYDVVWVWSNGNLLHTTVFESP